MTDSSNPQLTPHQVSARVRWQVRRNDEVDLTHWTGEIIAYTEDFDDTLPVGRVEATLVPHRLIETPDQLFIEMDAVSSDLAEIGNTIATLVEADDWDNNIAVEDLVVAGGDLLVIDLIEIDERVRKQGVPALVLRDLALINPGAALFALIASPVDLDGDDTSYAQARVKLAAMWAQLGFWPAADSVHPVLLADTGPFRTDPGADEL